MAEAHGGENCSPCDKDMKEKKGGSRIPLTPSIAHPPVTQRPSTILNFLPLLNSIKLRTRPSMHGHLGVIPGLNYTSGFCGNLVCAGCCPSVQREHCLIWCVVCTSPSIVALQPFLTGLKSEKPKWFHFVKDVCLAMGVFAEVACICTSTSSSGHM